MLGFNFNKMAVKLAVFLTILEVTSSLTSPRTQSGKHFAFAVPLASVDGRRVRGESAWLRFRTEEKQANVVLSFPGDSFTNLKSKYNHFKCNLLRSRACLYDFSFLGQLSNDNGVYLAGKVQADAPITGVFYVITSSWQGSAAIRLLPHKIWSTSYYVSTTDQGFPFIMIITYDSKVKVKVTFPKFRTPFNVKCGGNRNCASDSIVDLDLSPLMVWQLYIKRHGVYFHNTLVKADHPVCVIAGNTCMKDYNDNIDSGAFTIRPTESWGKEYIIPKFGPLKGKKSMGYFRITSLKIPFSYDLFQNGKNTKRSLKNYDGVVKVFDFRSPLIVRSRIPFGVYQYIVDGNQAGCQSIVPTEQWGNGDSYYFVDEDYKRDKVKLQRWLFTTAFIRNVVVKGKGQISWRGSLGYTLRTYNYGLLNIKTYPISAYSNQPNGRIIVYKVFRSFNDSSSAYFAMSSNFAKIYEKGCKKTDPLSNDGIDNDCDGFVDEEWKNKKDDDKDGLIDEDYIQTPGNPEWTTWKSVCHMDCDGKKFNKTIRDCKTTMYAYANESTCEGEDETCDSGQKCPEFCLNVNLTHCNCPPTCKTCASPKSYRCSECKKGYSGNHCLIPCPDGWKGLNCLIAPGPIDVRPFGTRAKLDKERKKREKLDREREEKKRKELEKKEKEKKEKERKARERREREKREKEEEEDSKLSGPLWALVILLAIALLVLLLLLLFCYLRRRNKDNSIEEEQDEEQDEEQKEESKRLEEALGGIEGTEAVTEEARVSTMEPKV